MKNYDYNKAKTLIKQEEKNGAKSAVLYMSEDYFWTGVEIWNNEEGYQEDLDDPELTIAGIRGSRWATPMIEFDFEDYKKTFECHDNGKSDGVKPLWV